MEGFAGIDWASEEHALCVGEERTAEAGATLFEQAEDFEQLMAGDRDIVSGSLDTLSD